MAIEDSHLVCELSFIREQDRVKFMDTLIAIRKDLSNLRAAVASMDDRLFKLEKVLGHREVITHDDLERALTPHDLPPELRGECSICRASLTKPQQQICGHLFDKDCITTWKRYNATCPLCRSTI